MRIEQDIKLDFNDVLIKPKRSNMSSRSEVDLNASYKTLYSKKILEGIPIIASNMDTVGTISMAKVLSKYNIFTCLHKFYNNEILIEFFKNDTLSKYTFYTLGTSENELKKLVEVYNKSNIQNICVDIANGYSTHLQNRLNDIRSLFPKSTIMAGNVCTPEMVQELIISCGVDIVKIGIGSGYLCSTRLVTGVGYPQLSAIIECADAAHGIGGMVCADGGCVYPADVAKSFGAGADFTMLGTMLSGHHESELVFDENNQCVIYGMSSKDAQDKYYGGMKNYRASEGRSIVIDSKGFVCDTIQSILGGLRSSCTYVGASKIKHLSKCTTFIRVSRVHNNMSLNS